MILDNPESHFIFIYHPEIFFGKKYTVYQGKALTNGEVLKYWGKWIVPGNKKRLHDLAKELDPLVEDKQIPCIKYDRNPSKNLGIEECVMMVYCDKRQSELVWKILEQSGVRFKAWVSEKETIEMWLPQGVLLERWIRSRHLNDARAEAVRKDSGEKLGYLFAHPDEVFVPWKQ